MGKKRKLPRTYALGDLHGAYLALIEVLRKVNFDYEQDTLIFLGDLADGWGEFDKCVEHLLTIKNLVPIIGNHDLYLMDFLDKGRPKAQWLNRGGRSTLKRIVDNQKIIPTLNRYFELAKPYHVVDQRIYCHGGFNHRKTIVGQKKVNFSINRKLYRIAKSYDRQNKKIKVNYDAKKSLEIKEIFIGHNTTKNFKPDFRANIINVDTGCGSVGNLTLMDVKNKSYVQSRKTLRLYRNKR